MKFFGSSLAIRDNFKVAFFGKKLTNVISKENCATFISGNQYDRLSQQSFLVAVASLSNSSREKYINTTERQAQGASAVCNKNFTGRSQLNTAGQCQIYWEADPQPSAQVSYTASAQNSGTVPQDWQLLKAWISYQIYIWITWFFFQISHFQIIFDGQWWKQISTHFSDSRYQECIIFAEIGDGPCNCY